MVLKIIYPKFSSLILCMDIGIIMEAMHEEEYEYYQKILDALALRSIEEDAFEVFDYLYDLGANLELCNRYEQKLIMHREADINIAKVRIMDPEDDELNEFDDLENLDQTLSQTKKRFTVLNWLYEINFKLEIDFDTFYKTVMIFDTFYEDKGWDFKSGKMQLVSIMSSMLAVKFNEFEIPSYNFYNEITCDSYTTEKMIKYEWMIASTLGFKVNFITPMTFINNMLWNYKKTDLYNAVIMICSIMIISYQFLPARSLAHLSLYLCISNERFKQYRYLKYKIDESIVYKYIINKFTDILKLTINYILEFDFSQLVKGESMVSYISKSKMFKQVKEMLST